ncbi:MAG: mechanosensitive ion channel MscS, partial [Spartobacteria bacterium]|nr:mechanosensitive ion channel MscS [Spartobacteria bacterium]
KFQIAYQADLKFVAETMERIVSEELGKEMEERVMMYRELLSRTPVDELEVRAHPRVLFRVDDATWIDAIVRYVVPPREAGSIKTQLIPKLLAALNAEPERVMFPKNDAR